MSRTISMVQKLFDCIYLLVGSVVYGSLISKTSILFSNSEARGKVSQVYRDVGLPGNASAWTFRGAWCSRHSIPLDFASAVFVRAILEKISGLELSADGPRQAKSCLWSYVNREVPDQPAHPPHGLYRPLTVIGYHILYEWKAKARAILHACAGWSEFAHFAHVWRRFSVRHDPDMMDLRYL